MMPVIESLAPVFLLIVLGYALRRKRFLYEGFWEGADRLTYFVLFPSLIIHTLADADFANLAISGMALALAFPVLLMAISLSLARPHFQSRGYDGPPYTSLFQGAIRPNTFVGLAAAAAPFIRAVRPRSPLPRTCRRRQPTLESSLGRRLALRAVSVSGRGRQR